LHHLFCFSKFYFTLSTKPGHRCASGRKAYRTHSYIKLLKIYENDLNKHKRIVHTTYNNIKYYSVIQNNNVGNYYFVVTACYIHKKNKNAAFQ